MKPLVSILIPAYNSQEWISETIRSAMAQTWPNKEIIVVDDGSADSTVDVVRKFECDFVRLHTQKNQGAAAARNTAFSLSKGDYIQWLDADDLLSPNKIAAQMKVFASDASNRTLLSCGWAWFMYRHDQAKFEPTLLWHDLTPAEWLIRKMEHNLHMQTATWLVSREVSEAAGPWNTALLSDDDGEYFCRLLLQSEGVRFSNEAKVYYRRMGSARLSYIGRSAKKLEAQWDSMQLHIAYLRSLDDSPRAHEACIRYLQNWSYFFYPERMDLFEKAGRLASSLGGHIHPPQFSWKYAWIEKVFGVEVAKNAQTLLRSAKWSALRSFDKLLRKTQGKDAPAI